MPKKKKLGRVINGLNHKERVFVHEYVSNKGNATEAALVAYRCKDRESAGTIGSRLLHRVAVQSAIDIAMKKKGVGDIGEYIESKTTTIIESGTTDKKLASTTVKDAMDGLRLLTKLKGIASGPSISLHKHYHGMSKSELLAERKKRAILMGEVLE
jgi:hypothetical protein